HHAEYPLFDKIVFGVWNEPNLSKFLVESPDGHAQVYGLLFIHASIARDRVDPRFRLGGPETDQNAYNSGYLAWALSWMAPYMHDNDVVTAHWYPNGRAPDLATYQDRVGGLVDYYFGGNQHERWLTETGRASCSDSEQANDVEGIATIGFRRIYPFRNWTKMFLYTVNTESNGNPNCDESITNTTWQPRLAYTRYKAITRPGQ